MTLIRKLPFSNPGSAGLPAFPLPSAEERRIYASPLVTRWWRADYGWSDEGWSCYKTGSMLTRARTILPERVTLAAYNGRQAIAFGNGLNEQLWDGGAGSIPATSAFSMVLVGRSGPGDSAHMIGGVGPDGRATYLTQGSTGGWAFHLNRDSVSGTSGGIIVSGGMVKLQSTGPSLVIASYDASATPPAQCTLDGSATATGATPPSPPENAGTNLQIGGISTTTATGVQGAILGGEIAEILIVNAALHVETGLRDDIEGLMIGRYAL